MKELRSFCDNDDTCLFVILILVGFLVCMFVSRNEGFLNYGVFGSEGSGEEGSGEEVEGHNYGVADEDVPGNGSIGKEPETLGIKLNEQVPSNGYGSVIENKYEMAQKGKQYKARGFDQSVGKLNTVDSSMPMPWAENHFDFAFVGGQDNQFGPDRPLDQAKQRVPRARPSQGPAPVQAGQIDTVSGVTPGGGNKLSLVLFYAPWCGHSKKMLPAYEKVKSEYHGKQSLYWSFQRH